MIPAEVQQCRNYIKLMFPGFFNSSWYTTADRYITKRKVRDACVAIGFAPKLVQIAIRSQKYYYYKNIGHGEYPNWGFYERFLTNDSSTGWSERFSVFPNKDGKPVSSVSTEEERDAEIHRLRSQGQFVGTKEEVLAVTGPMSSENPCGHLKMTCGCKDGLIVGEMYEISRKDKPSLQAQYIRWMQQRGNYSDSGNHEFRTLDGTQWISVKPADVKNRVTGKFRNVPTKPVVIPRNAFAAAQKQQVINRKARKASPNIDYQFRLYAIHDTGTDCMHALAMAAQSALGEKVDVKVTEGTIAALKVAIGDLTAWLELFQEKAKYPVVAEQRDGVTYATCDLCGEMVRINGGRYGQHKQPLSKQCPRGGKAVPELDNGCKLLLKEKRSFKGR